VDEMRIDLNPTNVPEFKACAATGEGVFETLKAVAKLILMDLKRSK
jgi:mutual gliding-motility protein MglA